MTSPLDLGVSKTAGGSNHLFRQGRFECVNNISQEGVKPTPFRFQLWIDKKAAAGAIR